MSLKGYYKKHKHFIKRWVTFFFALGVFLAGGLILWAANLKIPDFKSFDERQIIQSTKVYDRTGTVLLYNSGENVRRSNVAGTEISRNVKNATVAIEDREFYNHSGIRPTSIVRAFLANLTSLVSSGGTQGGSTITQQVIKNTILTQEKSLSRKLKEVVLALKLERVMSKDDILTLYLNESPYGGNIYGIEEASQAFFGKPSSDLTLGESAYLAALPQSPTRFSPYGSHKDLLEARKNLVLTRMQELGFATREEVEAAKKESVAFLPQNNFAIKAPHFVFYVLGALEEKYGQELLSRGGLKIITTLDWEKQKKTEEIVSEFAPINEKNYNAKNMGVVAEDPHTGEILVMVGSRDYYEVENDGNFNVTLAHRQPGSSFKPFVYATAFKKGYTPDTILFDLPTQFQTTCSPIVTATADKGNAGDCYAPNNYDGLFRGPMTLRSALAQSINVPSIEVLYLAGIKDSLATAADIGIQSLGNANQYGLTLVLGGGEVSPLEMTGAYATFASGGVYHPHSSVLSVQDSGGNYLEGTATSSLPVADRGLRVLDEQIAASISDILSDNTARAPSYGANSPLYFPNRDVAVKTGTTNDYKDMWTVGYSPELTLGIWVGNNDNTSMVKNVAGFVVAPMWRKIFEAIASDLPATPFVRPVYTYLNDPNVRPILRGIWQGGETYTIDKASGKLATQYTPPEMRQEVPMGEIHSILHWLDKENPNGAAPVNPASDPQYIYWETPVKLWAAANGYIAGASSTKPTAFDDVHTPGHQPVISIVSPAPNVTVDPSSRVDMVVNVTKHSYPIDSMEVYVNGIFVSKIKALPGGTNLNYSFVPSSIENIAQSNDLKVVVYDTYRNQGQATLTFQTNQ